MEAQDYYYMTPQTTWNSFELNLVGEINFSLMLPVSVLVFTLTITPSADLTLIFMNQTWANLNGEDFGIDIGNKVGLSGTFKIGLDITGAVSLTPVTLYVTAGGSLTLDIAAKSVSKLLKEIEVHIIVGITVDLTILSISYSFKVQYTHTFNARRSIDEGIEHMKRTVAQAGGLNYALSEPGVVTINNGQYWQQSYEAHLHVGRYRRRYGDSSSGSFYAEGHTHSTRSSAGSLMSLAYPSNRIITSEVSTTGQMMAVWVSHRSGFPTTESFYLSYATYDAELDAWNETARVDSNNYNDDHPSIIQLPATATTGEGFLLVWPRYFISENDLTSPLFQMSDALRTIKLMYTVYGDVDLTNANTMKWSSPDVVPMTSASTFDIYKSPSDHWRRVPPCVAALLHLRERSHEPLVPNERCPPHHQTHVYRIWRCRSHEC
eukprot:TRINITY_DN17242_c0_g1_i7.p1 TRINITY_DN17242_c0_g1~~TRINITY_DN17242_c0_g1_i7.p1  ORF type:complete len:434 (+),score=74.97 TRINITY_DN17242_c0_g1_i7:1204-2505(+)